MLPSGVFYGHTTCILGNGVALNIPKLIEEIAGIVEKGVFMPNILVSDRAEYGMLPRATHTCSNHHPDVDRHPGADRRPGKDRHP